MAFQNIEYRFLHKRAMAKFQPAFWRLSFPFLQRYSLSFHWFAKFHHCCLPCACFLSAWMEKRFETLFGWNLRKDDSCLLLIALFPTVFLARSLIPLEQMSFTPGSTRGNWSGRFIKFRQIYTREKFRNRKIFYFSLSTWCLWSAPKLPAHWAWWFWVFFTDAKAIFFFIYWFFW